MGQATDIAIDVIATCVRLAELHLKQERNQLDRIYNKAVRDVAAELRTLTRNLEVTS